MHACIYINVFYNINFLNEIMKSSIHFELEKDKMSHFGGLSPLLGSSRFLFYLKSVVCSTQAHVLVLQQRLINGALNGS